VWKDLWRGAFFSFALCGRVLTQQDMLMQLEQALEAALASTTNAQVCLWATLSLVLLVLLSQ
jgi:hypothetical protein